MYKSVTKALNHYVDQNRQEFDNIQMAETDIEIDMGDGIKVNGRIDLVKRQKQIIWKYIIWILNPAAYWRKLKQRLKEEGNEIVTNCHGLKMTAADGKKRMTDVTMTEQLLRIIQSIPSPKAEPFKLWLAEVGIVANVNLREWFGIDKNYCESTGQDVYQQQKYAALLLDCGNIDAFPFFKVF